MKVFERKLKNIEDENFIVIISTLLKIFELSNSILEFLTSIIFYRLFKNI